MRDDSQPRSADRDGKRLRPPDRELDRGGEENDPRGVDRSPVLGPEHDLDEPRHREEEDRHGNDHERGRANGVLADAAEHAGLASPLPVACLLREQDEAGR